MGDSAINYLGENGKSWSPIRGCSRCSPGCVNCWAERMAIRFAHPPDDGGEAGESWDTGGVCHGLVKSTPSGPRWTGEVRLIERDLDAPLRWRQPARVAVCFGGDLFHEQVPDEWIARVWAVMTLASRHTFLVLTKRAEPMRRHLSDPSFRDQVAATRLSLSHEIEACWTKAQLLACYGADPEEWDRRVSAWPLPNVRLGVSAENQATAAERIPHLLETPAAVRWVSVEPLLGAVDVRPWLPVAQHVCSPGCDYTGHPDSYRLDWIVLGCEQLPGRKAGRNAEGYPDHARAVIEQARAAGVPVWHKQMPINGRVSHDPSEWSSDLRVQEMPR